MLMREGLRQGERPAGGSDKRARGSTVATLSQVLQAIPVRSPKLYHERSLRPRGDKEASLVTEARQALETMGTPPLEGLEAPHAKIGEEAIEITTGPRGIFREIPI